MERVTVAEAARLLGVSKDAIRGRVRRDTIAHERDEAGNVYVYVEASEAHTDHTADHAADRADHAAVEAELRDRLRYVERQLELERDANRENRRLLMAALEHARALEPPREPLRGPLSDEEPAPRGGVPSDVEESSESRSWWVRWFGG